ncbi:hypothetical protein GP486_002777, partial [Trichoglossum hirsutum]
MPRLAGASEAEQHSQGSYFQVDLGQIPLVPPSARHRHRRSLESVIDFSHTPLTSNERKRAEDIFSRVIEVSSPIVDPPPPFDVTGLLRLSLRLNPSRRGRDNFLNYTLRQYDDVGDDTDCPSLSSSSPFSQVLDRLDQMISMWSCPPPEWVTNRTVELANLLLYFFFLPFKGKATKTPQPTPHLTPVGDGLHIPTRDRISNLRATCLARDNHRCVITGYFDLATAQVRDPAVDDSGQPLIGQDIFRTEVVHIVPHALGEAIREDSPLSPNKSTFWDVMKLFHPEMEQRLNGVEIDRPFNAMTMTADLHSSFGSLGWYLEEDSIQPEPHAYIFKESPGTHLFLNRIFRPKTEQQRVRFVSANGTELPDPGLIALHRACAKILGMSGAGKYIERLLRDDED